MRRSLEMEVSRSSRRTHAVGMDNAEGKRIISAYNTAL
jgi:hypothetical protein